MFESKMFPQRSSIGAIVGALIVFLVTMTTSLVRADTIIIDYSLDEEQPARTLVGDIVRDSNVLDLAPSGDTPELVFTFMQDKPNKNDSKYFQINKTSGEIRTATRIDRESLTGCRLKTKCELSIGVAILKGAFFKISQINIEIIDINDNPPQFEPSNIVIRISEHEPIGAEFMLPTATDPDKGQGNSVVAYSLKEPSTVFTLIQSRFPSSTFELKLRLDQNLNRESNASYRILLQAEDGGNPRRTGTLTINIQVIDENDNIPVFERQVYSANISEITAVNTVVVTVKARDYDAGDNGKVTYSMPSGAQQDTDVFSLFALNETTGQVRTKILLDPYAGGIYRLHIEAKDSGSTALKSSTEVTIHIEDTHNSDPEILLNVFQALNGIGQVSEEAELGRTVAHVAVSDPDSGLAPNGVVKCKLDSDHFQLQAMEVNQYKIILTQELDRERASYHSVKVFCSDSGSPPLNVSASFVIHVLDENDSPPVFDSPIYTADVIEGPGQHGDPNSDIVVVVHASDEDLDVNAQISYRLADDSDSDFGIFSDGSIVVTTATGLDREDPTKGAIRKLVVLAVDGGKPALTGTTTLTVTIRDTNDNPPRFIEPMYYFNVKESTQRGAIVNNVTATDDDLDNNAVFFFKMAAEYQGRFPFDVSPGGVIKVVGTIDREKKADYDFDVIAYDIGDPESLSSSVRVRVNIVDVNDNSPEFTFPTDTNNTVYIPHTLSANTGFGHLVAKDADDGKNGQLIYARDSGNGSKFFDIISESGEIVLIRALSIDDIGPHILTVAVHDMGMINQMATHSTLQIVVYEGNATLPHNDDGIGFRNIVVVVVLVVVTAVLGVAILLTILLIRRVDKQRRMYSAKTHDVKLDSKREFSPVVGIDLEATGSVSDLAGDSKDGNKKKKEVSFSFDEDNNMNNVSGSGLTSFGSSSSEKYDAILEKDRGKLRNDVMLSSNHFQADRVKKNHRKDVNHLTFHQVHPTPEAGASFTGKQEHAHPHEDNLSDVSGDVSTSDSGRGGSDVELQSHGGVSKDSGDTSFISQPGFHNNLNVGPGHVVGGRSNYNHNHNHRNPPANSNNTAPHNGVVKSVHFQNIQPDPTALGSFRAARGSPNPDHRPPRPQRPTRQNQTTREGHPVAMETSRYTPNIFTTNAEEGNGSYVQLANRNDPLMSSGHHLDRSKSNSARFVNNPHPQSGIVRYNSNSNVMVPNSPDGEYMDMTGARPFLPHHRSSSSPCVDNGWDGDTTTSGSYTVDPQELCEEIDKLFFEGVPVKDVVV